MIGWVLDHVPVWLWWALGIGAAVLTIPYWLPVWNALPRPVKAALIAFAAIFTAFAAGRRSGHKDAEDRRKQQDANAIKNRLEVDNEVRNRKPADRDRDLDRWMRD